MGLFIIIAIICIGWMLIMAFMEDEDARSSYAEEKSNLKCDKAKNNRSLKEENKEDDDECEDENLSKDFPENIFYDKIINSIKEGREREEETFNQEINIFEIDFSEKDYSTGEMIEIMINLSKKDVGSVLDFFYMKMIRPYMALHNENPELNFKKLYVLAKNQFRFVENLLRLYKYEPETISISSPSSEDSAKEVITQLTIINEYISLNYIPIKYEGDTKAFVLESLYKLSFYLLILSGYGLYNKFIYTFILKIQIELTNSTLLNYINISKILPPFIEYCENKKFHI